MTTELALSQIKNTTVDVDDYPTIQDALDTGLHVTGNGGIREVSATLNMTADGQKLVGVNGFTLRSSGLSTTSPILLANDLNGVEVEGVSFDCNEETYIGFRSTTSAGASTNFDSLRVHGCSFTNTFDTATSLYGALLVDNLSGASFTYKMRGVKLYNNTFENDTASHSSHGCLVAYCDDVTFTGNTIKSAGFHGMEAVQCNTVIISGNQAKNCYQSAYGVGTFCKNFLITGNTGDNCSGDGSITVEHNSVQGIVSHNVLTDCINQGINVSYGTGGSSPFNEVNNVSIHSNTCIAKDSAEGKIGINAYSSTGSNIGTGLKIENNTLDGFATGIECTWLDFGQVLHNTVRRLGTVSVGRPSKTFLAFVGCDKMIVNGNSCDTEVTLHAITIDTSTVADSRFIVNDNLIQSATAGALIRKIGSGELTASGNKTFGAVNYVSCDSTQNVTMEDNTGALSGNPLSGGALKISTGGLSPNQSLVGAGAVDTSSSVTHLTTTGVDALTLSDGVEGQRKSIVMLGDGGDGTLTPTSLGNGSTITFSDIGDSVELLFTGGSWHFMGGTATLA